MEDAIIRKFANYQIDDNGSTSNGSKFWDKGKWDNYIVPHLPEDVSGMTFVDMGCNAGLFLGYAEDYGFKKVVGVERNPDSIERGLIHRDKEGKNYEIIYGSMQEKIEDIPVCDYMTFMNSHYYILIKDWMDMVATLRRKARHVIITTTRKNEYFCMASAWGRNVKRYFKDWELINTVNQLEREGDPRPRSLGSLCFRNPDLKRVPVKSLLKGNHVQGRYYEEIEKGVMPLSTRYFKIMLKKKKKMPYEDIVDWMYYKVDVYNDIKKNGIKEPVIINRHNKILDGNHRKEILEYLGHETVLARIAC